MNEKMTNGFDNSDLIPQLLQTGLDINQYDQSGSTMLLHACAGASTKAVELLVESGADVDLCHENDCISPLHVACTNFRHEIAALLIEQRADVNAEDINFLTPLSYLCQMEFAIETVDTQTSLVELLLVRGASLNGRLLGHRPLLLASQANNVAVASMLIKYGANVNLSAGVSPFQCPLHNACLQNSLPMIELLVNSGASWYSEDEFGASPIDIVHLKGYQSHVSQHMNWACRRSFLLFLAGCNMAFTDLTSLYPQSNQRKKSARSNVLKVLSNEFIIRDVMSCLYYQMPVPREAIHRESDPASNEEDDASSFSHSSSDSISDQNDFGFTAGSLDSVIQGHAESVDRFSRTIDVDRAVNEYDQIQDAVNAMDEMDGFQDYFYPYSYS